MSVLTQQAKNWQIHSLWASALAAGLTALPALEQIGQRNLIGLVLLAIFGLAGGWMTLVISRILRGKIRI